MRPAAGDIIRAKVYKTTHFGIFFQYAEHYLLVLIPETSWTSCYASCDQLAKPGDEFDIVVIHDVGDGRFAASLKAMHPESDPWSGAWKVSVGDRITAKVARVVDAADRCNGGKGYLLELKPAAYAMLCTEVSFKLQKGQLCEVVVTQVDDSRQAIHVQLVQSSSAR